MPRAIAQVHAACNHEQWAPCVAYAQSNHACLLWCCKIFEKQDAQKSHILHWSVYASYVEIYNEAFHDLLNPAMKSGNIAIHEYQLAAAPQP